ncbi:sulfotransferase family 2 domain-containing protein [Mesorhizobium amorphae]|uniref:sulfotransferase family 2 domain-containing protein n=1 Tax=Mesorhizobium amorphae TaxID=71433 RepID=UPI00177C3C2F|nr:sulfotransferase family 2 domain-containing protein [Mesorhizobium amorphae]
MRLEAVTDQNFCEDDYLIANPDVRAAVEKGVFASGRQHFQSHGYREKRYQRAPLIFFVHVPKTAGSTVNSYLMKLLPDGSIHSEGWFYDDANMHRLDALSWVSGHIPYSVASTRIRQFTNRRVEYFACVRDPTDRVRSHYNWVIEIFHRSGYDSNLEVVKGMSEQIRNSGYGIPAIQANLLKYRWHFLDIQAIYLAKDREPVAGGSFGSFKFVATPDRLTDLLYTMTGKKVSVARRENKSSKHFDPQLFREPEMESFLRRHNALDEQLFEFVRSGNLCNQNETRILSQRMSRPWKERARGLALRAKRYLGV